jgi:TM2 domain-containing membrane protein YozV
MYKIIGADGQQYGPVDASQIKKWMSENRVNAQTLVLPEGARDWRPLSAIPELAPEPRTPPPLVPPPLPSSAREVEHRASSKIPAGICGILLGGFGVHKFILGYTGAGLIMLLVSLLVCIAGYPVMHVIGLIEGIVYLTKSDTEFVRTYVEQRREWF